ncbi:HD domain-containing protein [Clostridium sp. C105KSO13]|uniref:HD domain-containing protein n=1 Tax=Clostridium sp. C105KSO13 TaxID=1776045 RepID=UPI0007407E3D|nr:HD domain-containing protein [Clostridium sp. C105KSO13]CUX43092.1 putative nicotinate-nucleotide adenylyltransferase [Clostridium sp. C105KSO13]
MEVLEKIRCHPLYEENYKNLESAEENRNFCRHQMPHLLDVARIAYIRNLEEGMGFTKEVIYAAALLHDIGKYRQYEEKIPHEQAGQEIAQIILKDIDMFSSKEVGIILQAICEHRKAAHDMTKLGRLMYESDKLSRSCYACPAEAECNWSSERKNMKIDW